LQVFIPFGIILVYDLKCKLRRTGMSSISEKLGRRLAFFRKLRDMTQAELAEKVGLSNNFIALIESGKRAPSFETLERLIEVLNVNVNQIFNFEDLQEYDTTEEIRERLNSYISEMKPDDLYILMDLADKIKRGRTKT
jgi:transcriptional regulator with XRE-family HTH domain